MISINTEMDLDTSSMCSLLKRKLFEEDGPYHKIWLALQENKELTVVIRSRQLHIYRNGKKILILAGKTAPKVLCDDAICSLIQPLPLADVTATHKTTISLDEVIPQNAVCSQELRALFVEHLGRGFHFKAEFQDWLHNNAGKTYREAAEAYTSIEHPKEIKPQFEYNQYIRDFFADNKGATLSDAIKCWHWKKTQPGSHRYDRKDKDILR